MAHVETDLEKAIRVAVTAHAGQVDKSGAPYITHPLRLMAMVDSDEARCAAVLHDVVEDTTTTLDDLRREGISNVILSAVERLTHRKAQPYADYVVACKDDPIAREVKLADLTDNSRPDRCLLRTACIQRDLNRMHRYMLSYKFLTDDLSEADYRRLMQQYGELD